MKLSTCLLLLILVCLVPIVGVQLYAPYALREQRVSELDSLALHQAELANGDLASIVEGMQRLATVVAQFPELAQPGPACDNRLTELQHSMQSVRFLAAFDAAGHVLCRSAGATALAGASPAGWVSDLLRERAGVGRYRAEDSGRGGFVPIGVHVGPSPGHPVALVVTALDVAWLNHHLARVRIHPGTLRFDNTLYVADRDGVVVGRSPAEPGSIGRRLPAQLLSAARADRPGTERLSGLPGGQRLVASVPATVPPVGLVAIESLSLSHLTPSLWQMIWRDSLPTVGAALLALLLAAFIGRRLIARPTRELLAAAQRWRDGDLRARAPALTGGAELATLAQSFNAMAESLEARAAERRQHAELLEAQVMERTRALSESNNRLQVEIAEREKTEAALHQAQKLQAVGQLAGGIAHDFNNMLATVLGSLELMERRVEQSAERWTEADAARLRALIERATGAVQRGAQLTSQLLAFSRRQRLTARPTDLNRLIADLVTLATSTLGRRIRVTTVLGDELWPAMVDPSQVEAAILNCCLNARDAMPEGGQITISTANEVVSFSGQPDDPAAGSYVRVSITDTGSGMPPEVLRRAFEPFFTTKGPRGSGLGLSQVYGMARQSGGAVRISSAPDEGTTVTLLLPRAPAESEQGAAPRPDEQRLSLANSLVLVVDDDAAVRQVTVEMLKDLGCGVLPAGGGVEALAMLERAERLPDVVLLDYAMPGMNGVQLARALRARGIVVPMALVTGYAELAERETEASPFDALLRKPFTIRDLGAMLGRLRRLRPEQAAAPVREHGAV